MRYLIIFLILLLLTLSLFAQNTTDILMDSDKSITAHFRKIQYTLTTNVEPVGSGTINGAGTYDIGTAVEVKAIPAQGYVFDHWSFGNVKWSGLGMDVFNTGSASELDNDVDILLANGFTQLRICLAWYAWDRDPDGMGIQAAAISAATKGAEVIFGIQAGGSTMTSSDWDDYADVVKIAAQWAEDNGMYEFQIGNEEELHNDDDTLTDAQVLINLKILATEVQEIFTIGNISYSFNSEFVNDWITAGKGDIDLMALNVYMGGNTYYDDIWKTLITDLLDAFGADHTYLTEFAPSYTSLSDYSEDEAVQAAGVTEMIEYIKASGMTRALFFCYEDPSWLSGFGVLKDDGTYRLLWNSLLNSN